MNDLRSTNSPLGPTAKTEEAPGPQIHVGVMIQCRLLSVIVDPPMWWDVLMAWSMQLWPTLPPPPVLRALVPHPCLL